MKRISKYIYTLFIVCIFLAVPSFAQKTNNNTNRIVDVYNQPIQNALIKSISGDYVSKTNIDGFFDVPVSWHDDYVIISAVGYKDKKMAVADLITGLNIQLEEDVHQMGGEVSFGRSSYSKESITGAVASVSGKELEKTATNIFFESMPGRLPGLTVQQSISGLTYQGLLNFEKSIRGRSSINGKNPLVVIDGFMAPTQWVEFLSANEVESVSVLKDASATAMYGIKGANGVIVIKTKRGYTGKLKVDAYTDFSLQQHTKKALFVNSAKYAELRNEAAERDGKGPYSQFSQNDIDMFRDGTNPAYPNNNWYDMFVKDIALRQRVGINVQGGKEKFRYFSNLSFTHQGGLFKVADEPGRDYNPDPRTFIGNFRTNVDITFSEIISGYMNFTGNLKKELLAGGYYNWDIYRNIMYQPPTMFGPLSPVNEDETISNQVMTIDGLDLPAYGMINRSGYRTYIETNVIAQAGVKFKLDFLTKGLSAGIDMGYQTYLRNETGTNQDFIRVIRQGSDYSDMNNFKRYTTHENTPLSYNKSSFFNYYLNLRANIDYLRYWGNHMVNATAGTTYLIQETDATGNDNKILPYKHQLFNMSALYGYKNKYFIKADLGYAGSEQFHKDHRYTVLPVGSLAWILSNEEFFNFKPVSLLKLRASYGLSANDQLGDARFLYLDNIRSDGNELERGNKRIEAEKIKKLNIGIDAGLFDMFTINFDYFSDRIDNMLIGMAGKIPEYQGIPLQYYPKYNEGRMKNEGYEIGVAFHKQLSKDFSMFIQANYMHTSNKVLNINESSLGDDYAYPRRSEGYPIGTIWGYQIDKSNGNGIFNSEQELIDRNLSYSFGTPRVGDFIYKDLNADGKIDEKDKAPLGNSIPQNEFTLNGNFRWKNWEMSFLFQGLSKFYQCVSGVGVYEYESKGVFSDLHMHAWTPERYANGEKITYPALSLTRSTNHESNDFFLSDRSFLRLRNIELAYNLPHSWMDKLKMDNIRIALNIQNLFTIDNMISKYLDPEMARMNEFQPFRTYNLSLSATF